MTKKHPVAVLDDVYYKPVSLVDVYVCNITDKKKTGQIVNCLKKDFPLRDLSHVKRVRAMKDSPLQVIICDASYDLEQVTITLTSQDYLVLSKPYKVKVSSEIALTRNQYEEAILYWPVNFHEDKSVTKALTNQLFDEVDISNIYLYMAEAVTMASKAAVHDQMPIGAVVVDPALNQVIAKGHDLRGGNHPLQHAVMVTIDLVARSQGGGMWPLISHTDMYYNIPQGGETSAMCDSVSVQPQVNTSQVQGTSTVQGHDITGGQSDDTASLVSEAGQSAEKTGPYLCTGYDLYVTKEPCVMCAMALVHSRIGRVFYSSPDHKEGALGSKYKLHTQTGLNHHYKVYTIQCDQTFDSDVT